MFDHGGFFPLVFRLFGNQYPLKSVGFFLCTLVGNGDAEGSGVELHADEHGLSELL